jgi:hypothetical protein
VQKKKILFLVQSGFPEAIQSEGIRKYLNLLAKRWQMQNLGVIVKPGAEGIRLMPGWMTRTLTKNMIAFGKDIALGNELNKAVLKKLAHPYQFSKTRIVVFKIMSRFGLTNFYWNMNLKKYNAFQKRFDAPYLEEQTTS